MEKKSVIRRHEIQGLTLTNFKAYGEETDIPLGKITLILGKNSSGKSSIVNALTLLKQTYESRDTNAPLQFTGLIDFGGYEDLVFSHQPERDIRIALEVPLTGATLSEFKKLHGWTSLIYEITYSLQASPGRHTDKRDVTVTRLKVLSPTKEQIASWKVRRRRTPKAKTKPRARLSSLNRRAPFIATGQSLAYTDVVYKPFFDTYSKYRDVIFSTCEKLLDISLELPGVYAFDSLKSERHLDLLVEENRVTRTLLETHMEVFKTLDRLGNWAHQDHMATLKEFRETEKDSETDAKLRFHAHTSRLLREFLSELEQRILEVNDALPGAKQSRPTRTHEKGLRLARHLCKDLSRRRANLAGMVDFYQSEFTLDTFKKRFKSFLKPPDAYVQGFLPRARAEQEADSFLLERDVDLFTPEFTDIHDSLNPLLSGWHSTDILGFLGLRLGRVLDRFRPLSPARRPPERVYVYRGAGPAEGVGYDGEYAPDLLYRDEALVQDVNAWFKKLELGYEIEAVELSHSLRRGSSNRFEVVLTETVDENTSPVPLTDVGFGISDLLPLIVQCRLGGRRRQVIAIEQPEAQIHPRLQAALGTLFAESHLQFGHQFIIETHSEHLLLRMRKLVRDGVLDKDDVCVLYVERDTGGSTVRRLRLNAKGHFIDEFPADFYPDRIAALG